MDIHFILKEKAKAYPAKPAIVFNNDVISFSVLYKNVAKLASALSALGIKKGDKVAICLLNCPQYAYSYLACACLGVVSVPLDFMLKNDELISCLNHSEANLLIANPKPDISFDEIKRNVPSLEAIILISGEFEGALSFDAILNDAVAEVPRVNIKDTDLALIMYTSGTTGQPKGIMLNFKHL